MAAFSGTIVASMLLAYRLEPPPCTARPAGDGCGPVRPDFGDWVVEPFVIAAFAVAFVLLVIAGERIRRGLARSGRPATR